MDDNVDWSAVNWYEIGKAQRRLISDVIDFENEMTRIDRTTYWDKKEPRLEAADRLRDAVQRYSDAIRRATPKIAA